MSAIFLARSRRRRIEVVGLLIIMVLLLLSLLHAAMTPKTDTYHYSTVLGQNSLDTSSIVEEPFPLGALLQEQQDSIASVNSRPSIMTQTLPGRAADDSNCSSPLLFPVSTTSETAIRSQNNAEQPSNASSSILRKSQYPKTIPPVIYTTSRVSCMTARYLAVFDQWRTLHPLYSVRLYDDTDVDQYFRQTHHPANDNNSADGKDSYWSSMFPKLRQALLCLPQHNGASKADIWRYLVLWDQGGVYTDIDNAPGRGLRDLLDSIQQRPPITAASSNATTSIHSEMDAIIPINKRGRLSQFFFLTAPRHPLLYLALAKALDNLLKLPDLSAQDASHVTGPFVLMDAMDQFQFEEQRHEEGASDNLSNMDATTQRTPYDNYTAGVYRMSPHLEEKLQTQFPGQTWMIGRTVTVLGDRKEPHRYVRTILTGSAKKEYYRLVNMQQWQTIKKNGTQHEWHGSCEGWLLELERRRSFNT